MHIRLNEYFAKSMEQTPDFELITPPFLNFTCFRWKPPHITDEDQLNELNEQLLDAINKSGELFLSHTKVQGKYALRMLIGQTYVEKRHIRKAISNVRTLAAEIES